MKTAFQITQYLMLMFMVLITLVITVTEILGGPRRPWSEGALLEMILVQACMLGVYFIAKIGVYMCNTYKIERVR